MLHSIVPAKTFVGFVWFIRFVIRGWYRLKSRFWHQVKSSLLINTQLLLAKLFEPSRLLSNLVNFWVFSFLFLNDLSFLSHEKADRTSPFQRYKVLSDLLITEDSFERISKNSHFLPLSLCVVIFIVVGVSVLLCIVVFIECIFVKRDLPQVLSFRLLLEIGDVWKLLVVFKIFTRKEPSQVRFSLELLFTEDRAVVTHEFGQSKVAALLVRLQV